MKKIYTILSFLMVGFFALATNHTITASGLTFNPANLTISQGDSVTWSVGATHPVLEVSMATYNANGSTGNGGFSIPSGNGFQVFNTPGTYYYICTNHIAGGMKGTITVNATPPPSSAPWINEIHYDNAGVDTDEGVEIAGVSGTDLSCFKVYLYNGNNNNVYDSISLTGTIDDEGCGYGAIWFGVPSNGMQNGAPDGIGLYNTCTSTVIQFLSYEGVMTAGNGALSGTVAEEIPVYESGIQPVGGSLQLMGFGTSYGDFSWDSTVVNSYGDLNPNQSLCGAPADTIVNFTTTSATTVEAAGTYVLNLKLNQASTGGNVDVALLSGNAANLNNYTTQTVNFAAASTTATLSITLTDDALIEADEIYTFILQSASAGFILGPDSIFTLTVNDDDTPTPTYDLATVTTVNALGEPDSLNVLCKVYGLVNSPDRGFNSTEFSIQDATGAITVYDAPAAVYEAVVGDSVEVIGYIGQRFGVTTITDLVDITVLSSGSTVMPTAAAQPNEANESSLIRVDGLQMVNPSDWTPNTGSSGFDVEVFTSVNDTFIVRIDRDYLDLYSTTDIPCGVFNVIGVAGQYDVDTPYTSNYQLIPRFLSDVEDTCTTVTPAFTIAQLTEVDANGDPILLGTVVEIRGIITSPDFRETQNGTEFTFSDGTGGIWAYSSDSMITFDPIVGDSVLVSGNIGAASGVTRLYIDNVSSLGAATPLSPVIVASALGEAQEAELIKIENMKLNGVWNSSGGSYNVSATASGITYDIRVDADRAELFTVPLTTAVTFNLTGVGSQFDSSAPRTEGYQIMPRFASDIEIVNAIQDLNLDNFTLSPIPASNVLNISFDYDFNELASIEIVNVLGQVVLLENMNLTKGANNNSISVSSLGSGFYFLKINTSKGVSTSNIMVK
ncbi:MAG: T9SS type A sorting domain-containing protein [Chitinophagales bacterium]|nr:T9SS type A sorting domain-containing protein [Chitinophagales bacterium]